MIPDFNPSCSCQCKYEFVQTQTTLAITKALSDARFDTYRTVAGGSDAKALELYLWNIGAAGAVAATTGMVEVQLRNSIDALLQGWNENEPVNEPGRSEPYPRGWLKDPAPRLRQIISPANRPPMWKKAEPALLGEDGNPTKPNPTHDDLVAALPFGSWLFLLPRPEVTSSQNPRMRVWNEALSSAFAPKQGSSFQHASHAVIYKWASTVRFARNRASHLEPLLEPTELMRYHKVCLRLMNSMNPAAASWLAGQQYIPAALRRRPF